MSVASQMAEAFGLQELEPSLSQRASSGRAWRGKKKKKKETRPQPPAATCRRSIQSWVGRLGPATSVASVPWEGEADYWKRKRPRPGVGAKQRQATEGEAAAERLGRQRSNCPGSSGASWSTGEWRRPKCGHLA